jgi:hypothetical protein
MTKIKPEIPIGYSSDYRQGFINGKLEKEKEVQSMANIRSKPLVEALEKIIEMNRQQGEDQYGDRERAENWSCVKVAREALTEYNQYINQKQKA